MSLSYLEIQHVLQDLAPLQGSLLRDVYQPTRTELILSLRTHSGNRLLLLSVHPTFSRLHLLDRRPSNPAKPHPFQMLCRKALRGRMDSLEQVNRDRVVRCTFHGEATHTVVAELTGRHGNIFLLDANDRILGTLRPLRADRRNLAAGSPYVPLPTPRAPVNVTERFSTRSETLSYQEAVAGHYETAIAQQALEALRTRIQAAVRKELKRLTRRASDLESDLAKAEQAEQYRRYGDVLQIHLPRIPRGRSFVVLPDPFEENQPLEVPLDPELDPLANMRRHYRRYKKYNASIPFVLQRLEEVEARSRELISLMPRLEAARDEHELQQLVTRHRVVRTHVEGRGRGAKSSRPPRRLPHHRYVTPAGREIWVGKSGRDNERLTFQVARGNDFWVHVLGRPGAHVVIPCRPALPDLETLLDAGMLALRHSGRGAGEKAEVCYTRVKHVRKIPGGAPGQVTFSQEKSLMVTVDAARLARLTRFDEQEIECRPS